MEQFVETGDLILPSADLLIAQVIQIEKTLPGWWWSLSFTETNVCLTTGPDRQAPNPAHVKWMNTREGDTGVSYTTYTHGGERKIILPQIVETSLKHLADILTNIGVPCAVASSTGTTFVPHESGTYRHQRKADLEILHKKYQRLLDELDFIRKSEYVIREFYIGSCGLSVDCSIRGGDDEHTFDHSYDLIGGACIGDSVDMSLDDLLAEVAASDPKRTIPSVS